MGANNWATCPKCLKEATASVQKRQADVAANYGKVPADQFLRDSQEAAKEPDPGTTLREDYELGVDECGNFEVQYSCSCHTCNFSFNFKAEQKVPLETDPPRKTKRY